MNRTECIQQIRELPQQLAALTHGLTAAQLTTHFLPDEWTVAQNVHHLFDSHANAYIRARLILTEDRPALKPYNQDAWAALPDASAADIATSLTLLTALHARWVSFWEALDEADFARSGLHPEYGEMSLDAIVRSYARHGLGHLDQIQRTLAAETAPA